MVRQYLDTISWLIAGSDTEFDDDGNPIPGNEPIQHQSNKSRYENINGSRKEFLNKSNQPVLATGTIYLKKGESIPPRFTIITIDAVNRDKAFEAEVLAVNYGQLNTTIHLIEYVGN